MELDKYEKLKELKKLLDDNLICKDEFQELKKDILDSNEIESNYKKIKKKTSHNVFRNIIVGILLLLGVYSIFNYVKKNDLNTILNSKKNEFNAVKEFDKINNLINNKITDSTSNTFNDYQYTFWYKDGKIIKLNVFGTDNEDLSSSEDYYFNDNNNVFAYKIKDVNLADNKNYTALIYFNESNIVSGDYWVNEMNSDNYKDEKKSKDIFEDYLKQHGSSIQNISQDENTKKSIGLLTLSDLSKRYGFDYKTILQNSKSQAQNNNSSETNSIKQFKDVQLTLMYASLKKVKLYLGEPDKIGLLYMGGSEKNAAIYLNKVNDNGITKHLVLFLRYYNVEEIYAIRDNEKAYFGIHYVEVKNNNFYSNSVFFDKY